jgi:hypothetical protein
METTPKSGAKMEHEARGCAVEKWFCAIVFAGVALPF